MNIRFNLAVILGILHTSVSIAITDTIELYKEILELYMVYLGYRI